MWHVPARAIVSHWQDQYHRTLNAACLRVKVEPITMLTESPALNWPCAVFASRRYNAIRCHRRDWRWEHARTHRSCRTLLSCSSSRAVVRGVEGVGTHAAQRWVTSECSGLWLAKYKQIASQSPGWLLSNKYSKISNSCISFESNRIASNYSIRFEISNIRTALLWNSLTFTWHFSNNTQHSSPC